MITILCCRGHALPKECRWEVLDGCLRLVDIGGVVTARRHGIRGKCELRIIIRGEQGMSQRCFERNESAELQTAEFHESSR